MNPWGRDQELEADKLGMMIIHWAGYDISHIPAFWQAMAGGNPNSHDFFSTHPSDSKRIAVMNELIHEIENQKDFYSSPVLDTLQYLRMNSWILMWLTLTLNIVKTVELRLKPMISFAQAAVPSLKLS